MGRITFRRRFTIIPNFLYLNINRGSWSITTRVGPVGHTRSSTGRRTTSVNLPGRGVGYRHTTTAAGRHRGRSETPGDHRGRTEEERAADERREDLQRRVAQRREEIRRGWRRRP
jgi:hypothetical protein